MAMSRSQKLANRRWYASTPILATILLQFALAGCDGLWPRDNPCDEAGTASCNGACVQGHCIRLEAGLPDRGAKDRGPVDRGSKDAKPDAGPRDNGPPDKPQVPDGSGVVARINIVNGCTWVTTAGGADRDQAYAMALDSSGNPHITGFFSGTATFATSPKTTLTATAASSDGGLAGTDMFVAKLNGAGTFQWATSGGGTDQDQGLGIVVDRSGNSYVTGAFGAPRGTKVTFGTLSVTSNGRGAQNLLVAGLNNSGTWIWATTQGPAPTGVYWPSYATGHSIALLNDSPPTAAKVVTGGSVSGGTQFGTETVDTGSHVNGEILMVSNDSKSGAYRWIEVTKTTGPALGLRYNVAYAVATDNNRYIWLGGHITGVAATTKFHSSASSTGTIQMSPGLGVAKAFVAKYDNNAADFVWIATADGNDRGLWDAVTGLAVDSSKNVYVIGTLEDVKTTFNHGDGSQSSHSITASQSMFVGKLDTKGKWLWVSGAQVKSDRYNQRDWQHAVDVTGNGRQVYVTGHFVGTVSFGSTPLSAAGLTDIYVAKLDGATGAFLSAKGFGGSGYDTGASIALDPTETSVYLAGSFSNNVNFGTGRVFSAGSRDIFVCKIK